VGALVRGPAFHPYLSGGQPAPAGRGGPYRRFPDRSRRISAALERVGLSAGRGQRYRSYSLGMKQRLAIRGRPAGARANCSCWTEPTNGLDPQGTREVRALVGALAARARRCCSARTLLAEVNRSARTSVMHRGKAGRPGAAGPIARGRRAAGAGPDGTRPAEAARVLAALGLTDVPATRRRRRARLDSVAPEKVVAALVQDGIPVRGFAVEAPSLEDVFLGLTGKGFDVSG